MELGVGKGGTLQTPILYWVDDASAALENVRAKGARWEKTTIGRALFNAIIPTELGFKNHDMKKKALSELVFESYRQPGLANTVQFLDRLKEFGFAHATRRGISIRLSDLHIPSQKEPLLEETTTRLYRFQKA